MNVPESLQAFEQQLSGLEDADPYMAKTIQQAHELEYFLNDPARSSSQTELDTAEVNLLGKEWLDMMSDECPYLYDQVFITGDVTRAYHDDFEGQNKVEKVTYEHQEVTSFGFGVLIEHEGETSRSIVGHLFHTESIDPSPDSTTSLVDYVPRFFAFAPVGSIDIRANLPDEMNMTRLENEIPELVADIDCIILNTNNECDAVRSLSSIAISEKDDIPNDVLERLAGYICNRLDFDKIVPYEMTVQGLCYVPSNTDSVGSSLNYFAHPCQFLAAPLSLSLQKLPMLSEEGQVSVSDDRHWMLEVQMLGNQYDDNDSRKIIPVANIKGMSSIRKHAYGRE